MGNLNKLCFAGCKDTTLDCMSAITSAGYTIDLLITIDAETAEKNKVAGYTDLAPFCKANNIEVYYCSSYSLIADDDKTHFANNQIGTLLVIGWQRLIPEWLLKRLEVGAFGMHGSPRPLPHGRGRSPMNWSLVQNKSMFITNLFKYNPGVDDGDILETQHFDINQFDTALTCHYKNTLAMISLLKKRLTDILNNDFQLTPQQDVAPTFYPKRSKKDGILHWDLDTTEIYNTVRAVTFPFPGAFSFLDDQEITIWKAQPFDTRVIDFKAPSGTILMVFSNGSFVIRTGSDSMLVTEYDADNRIPKIGDVLNSADYDRPEIYNLPTL